MAAVDVYVNTDNGGTEDGTTHATGWATLADAIADMNSGTFNSDDVTIHCAGATDDTTSVNISFSDTPTSITIKGDAAEADGTNTGATSIDTAFYLLAPGDVTNALSFNETTIATTLDGIQLESGHTGTFGSAVTFAGVSEGVTWTVKNCRIRNASSVDVGIGKDGTVAYDGTIVIENNIIIDFQDRGVYLDVSTHRDPDINIRHNTIYGGFDGIRIDAPGGSPSAHTWNVQGNAVAGTTNDITITTHAQTTLNQADNYTDDSGRHANDHDIGTLTDAWTSHGTGRASDFTVKDTSSNLYDAVDPVVSTNDDDILGEARGTAPNDAGAFELVSGSDVNGSGTPSSQAATMSAVGTVSVSGSGTPSSVVATTSSIGEVILSGAGAAVAADAVMGGSTVLVSVKGTADMVAQLTSTSGTVKVSIKGLGTVVSAAATLIGFESAQTFWFAIRPIVRRLTRDIKRVVHTPLDRR